MATMKMPCAVGSGGNEYFEPVEYVSGSNTRMRGSWSETSKYVVIVLKRYSDNNRYIYI